MTFFTKVTANPNATQETLERQHVVWNKGLADCHSAETRANISKTLKGKKQSAETRAKRTKSLKEYYSSHKKAATRQGAKHSAESLAKMSAAHKGKTMSAETRTKLSAANKGKKQSAETCAKRSAAIVKPIMTPHGLFPSLQAVIEASGTYGNKVRSWMKKYPEHYYYI